MKKTIILLSLFISYSYSQIQPTVSDFLISGTDNSPSSFVQNNPKLFVTNSNNFVVSWVDYRKGEPTIYAQKFDKDGNKIGVNFKTNSGSGIHLNKKGYLLSLHTNYVSYIDDSYSYLYAALIDNLNQQITEKEIYTAYLPWCGTGFIPGENIVTASDNNFYFLTNFGGQVSLVKIENTGDIKSIDTHLENMYHITQITSTSTSKGDYFFAWINGLEQDSMYTGLFATFINSEDSVFVSRLFISQLADSVGLWDYVGNYTLKSIAINDSTYKLFWLNNASLMLYSVKLNIKGEIVSNIDSLQIPNTIGEYSNISNIILTNKTEDGFYLYLSQSNYNSDPYVYSNSIIKFNAAGEKQGNIINGDTSSSFTDNLFNIGDNKFYRVSSDRKDVFLDKMEYSTLLQSTKINDDISGSNQHNQRLIKYDNNTLLSIWKDEEKYYRTKLDKDGNIIGEKTEINNPNILFFPDKESIVTWTKNINNSTYSVGYTIFNQDFSEKLSKTLFTTNSPYNLSLQIQIFSDSNFVALLNSASEMRLIEESKNGNTLKENEISKGSTIYDAKIFPDNLSLPINSFWMTWDSKLQKFSSDLEPLGIVKDISFSINNYIGDDRFLTIRNEYDEFYVTGKAYGTIINSDLDTIKSNILLNKFKSGSNNLIVTRLDDNEFLVINKYSNKYSGRSYSNDGIAKKDTFVVNRYSTSYTSDLRYIISNGKIFFTWSDARTSGKGYDIYGSVFDLKAITAVKEITSQTPTNFQLFQNYPNPFNPSTKIRFSIPGFSHVRIKIYNVLGNEIATLVDEDKFPGIYEVLFNGNNFASGIYFYTITAGGFSETRKMVFLK